MRILVAAVTIFGLGVLPALGAPMETAAADAHRMVAAGAVVLAYLCLSALVLMRHAAQRTDRAPANARDDAAAPVLIAYASQTGTAEQLARSTSQALREAHLPAQLLSFSDLDAAVLAKARLALFIVSTTGEGDPPDAAARFVRTVMREPVVAPGLRYGVLALGDSAFTRFCAFGEAVDTWLAEGSARRMFEAIRVDNGDPASLAVWWQRVQDIAGQPTAQHAAAPAPPWRLSTRTLANPANPEHGAYYVTLRPTGALPQWSAGDIAVVRPRNDAAEVAALLARAGLDGGLQLDRPAGRQTLFELLAQSALPQTDDETAALARLAPALLAKSLQPLAAREYSIASLPADGGIELLVRQVHRPDGRLGLGSGWLTQHAPVGSEIELSLRTNAAFHPPDPQRPLILIGNGTGIAGLRAHLRARAAQGAGRNWLIFGERSADKDFFYRDDISRWRRSHVLERVDFAFSRDQEQRAYVQDCVRRRGEDIRAWIEAGAAIYVCGSLRGMSTAVTEALGDIIGAESLAEMIETGRYRRDVY